MEMKHLARIFSLTLVVLLTSLFITTPALAIPPLPSSFYGTVKVNDANVPDGTAIQALIGGQVYAEGLTQTYQGNSVYALDVRGDDPDTAVKDGGREGDVIQFKIGGALANQTGVWHTGTNVNLDLTASSSVPITTPQDTPSPVPTQTAIEVIQQPSPTPTKVSLASPTPAVLVQSSPTATAVATKQIYPSPILSTHVQPSPTPIPLEKEDGARNIVRVVVVILVLSVITLMGFMFWKLPKKM
jgi:hypothetical protein